MRKGRFAAAEMIQGALVLGCLIVAAGAAFSQEGDEEYEEDDPGYRAAFAERLAEYRYIPSQALRDAQAARERASPASPESVLALYKAERELAGELARELTRAFTMARGGGLYHDRAWSRKAGKEASPLFDYYARNREAFSCAYYEPGGDFICSATEARLAAIKGSPAAQAELLRRLRAELADGPPHFRSLEPMIKGDGRAVALDGAARVLREACRNLGSDPASRRAISAAAREYLARADQTFADAVALLEAKLAGKPEALESEAVGGIEDPGPLIAAARKEHPTFRKTVEAILSSECRGDGR